MIDYELAESYYKGVVGSASLAETSRIPRIAARNGCIVAARRRTVVPDVVGTVCAKHLKVPAATPAARVAPAAAVSAVHAVPASGASAASAVPASGMSAAQVDRAQVSATKRSGVVLQYDSKREAAATRLEDERAVPASARPAPERPAARVRQSESSVPIISVVSASGGTGRSTIALLAAYLCARAGLATVLIEGDLQFGDYAFWLGLDDRASALGDADVEAVELADNLRLFKAPLLPEAAEEVSDGVAAALPRLAQAADVVIADTGAFWNGLTARLLLSSTLFFMVVDRRPSSIMDAVKAAELCTRIGVPALRMVPVYNRWSSRALIGADEARKALDADDIYCIPEGKQPVEDLLGKGDVAALVESENPAVLGVERLLEDVLPRVGHLYSPPERGSRRKRRGGLA